MGRIERTRDGGGDTTRYSGRHARCRGDIVEEWREQGRNTELVRDLSTSFEGDPCALVFAIATLDDFVFSRQNLLLKDLCAPALIDPGDFEDLGSVDIGIDASAHDGNASHHALVDLDGGVDSIIDTRWLAGRSGGGRRVGCLSRRHGCFGVGGRHVFVSWIRRVRCHACD